MLSLTGNSASAAEEKGSEKKKPTSHLPPQINLHLDDPHASSSEQKARGSKSAAMLPPTVHARSPTRNDIPNYFVPPCRKSRATPECPLH